LKRTVVSSQACKRKYYRKTKFFARIVLKLKQKKMKFSTQLFSSLLVLALSGNQKNASAFSTNGKTAFGLSNSNSLYNGQVVGTENCGNKNDLHRLMCGLVAAIDDIWTSSDDGSSYGDIPLLNNHKDNGDNKLLLQTADILYHRGPDGMTVASGTIGQKEARWALGHTRLAIVDPSNRKADMPFQLDFEVAEGETKIIKLAANGEIYNHEKVYADLVSEDNWPHERISGSDCEVIAHHFAKHGGPATAKKLDGMFAFVIFEENTKDGTVKAFAARDPVGIKPLYYGRALPGSPEENNAAGGYVFSSELKALVNHVDPSTVVAIPPGHYWTPEEGLVCFYNPDWLRKDDYAPWEEEGHEVTDDEIREAFTKAVEKRMMADVDYGFFLSGGVDSAVVSNVLMPLYRKEQEKNGGEFRRIPTFTVGMENSPDVMAAKAVVEELGGDKYIDHKIRYFTPDEVFGLIPKIIYHLETYEAELIRSSIPNWFLAEHAAKDVKMVLTGEGSDELFAGYLYFQDAENPTQVQNELRRIYNMLGNINLHRTDRMTMAHGLEARVPFLDTEFTRLIMSVNPEKKMVDREAVKNNARGREKTMLRELFEAPNVDGEVIPRPVLWRAKAMQCEGVGEDWVSILQGKIAALVSDEEMEKAAEKYPLNTPQTKEELYYRNIFDGHFKGMDHVVKLWPGGGRAMGAEWKSDMYTREGLKNVSLLSHSLQKKKESLTVLAAHKDQK
jgi:asparagine synthase (glutamine-hydrolysing)